MTHMQRRLVLSLFPGADLFGMAFEQEGFCVVRGPDILLGQDIANFHVPSGAFDGVIGGPPCQLFSGAVWGQTGATNLIPEFMRVFDEAAPNWAVMENVHRARHAAPNWDYVVLEDFDCGGLTSRKRAFWFYGIYPPGQPDHRVGQREYSVLATSWKERGNDERHKTYPRRTAHEAAMLQGINDQWVHSVSSALPAGMTPRQKEIYMVHLLGNGVPIAMGRYVAQYVKEYFSE